MFEKLGERWQYAMAINFTTIKAVLDVSKAVAYEKGSEALAIPFHTVVSLFNYRESVDSSESDLEGGTLDNGGDMDDVHRREKEFGSNMYLKRPKRRLFSFMWDAFKDVVLVTLLVCVALSLGFGIKKHGFREGWCDGGSIFFAVFAVIMVSAAYNFWQHKQFDWLGGQNDIQVNVVRSGRQQKISIFNIFVGDVVCLSIGDRVPADGLFLDGHSVQVDESSMTGESSYVEVNQDQPFLLSGSTVADGYGRMLVISVGMNTTWGKMMSSISCDSSEQTPLEAQLNKLSLSIGKVGLAVAFLVLMVLLIRYFTGNTQDENGNQEFTAGQMTGNDIMSSMVGIIATAVAMVVVVIPERLLHVVVDT